MNRYEDQYELTFNEVLFMCDTFRKHTIPWLILRSKIFKMNSSLLMHKKEFKSQDKALKKIRSDASALAKKYDVHLGILDIKLIYLWKQEDMRWSSFTK